MGTPYLGSDAIAVDVAERDRNLRMGGARACEVVRPVGDPDTHPRAGELTSAETAQGAVAADVHPTGQRRAHAAIHGQGTAGAATLPRL